MRVTLINTLNNIVQSFNYFSEYLEIFKIINFFSPREWTFTINFDECNRYHLYIEANPHLSEQDILNVLDGQLEAIYGFGEIKVKVDDKWYSFNTKKHICNGQGRNLEVHFDKIDCSDIKQQIEIVDFKLNAKLHKKGFFFSWLKENTWLGSHLQTSKKKITLQCLSQLFQDDLPNEEKNSEGIFSKRFSLISTTHGFLGDCIMCLNYVVPKKTTVRHSQYGVFSLQNLRPNFLKDLNLKVCGDLIIEINNPLIKWYSTSGPKERKMLLSVLECIVKKIADLKEEKDWKDFYKSYERYQKGKSAEKLIRRQSLLQKHSMVSINKNNIFKTPTCENDVVALYMKLEGMKCLPFECKILEYTPREGIDALGDFRLSKTAALKKLAPIEFEYVFENYYDHNHDPEQTELIICWDSETIDCTNNWLEYIEMGNKKIPVVLLSKIDGLKLTEN